MPRKTPHDVSDDDFDGIKLEGYVEPTGPQDLSICWSCQKLFGTDRLVCLGGECVLPVCTHCWGQMPVADRLTAAKALSTYGEENESRQQTRRLVSIAAHVLETIKKEHGEQGDDDGDKFSWLTGRRN